MAYQAINHSGVKTAVNLIHRDLIEIGSLVTSEIFDQLDMAVIEGIQNKDTNFIFRGNEKVATKYIPGQTSNASLGAVLERELNVKNVAANLYDNIQMYRETEPFDIVGVSDDGALNCKETEKRLRLLAQQFANQILRNLVAGNRSLAVGNGYELYDGFNTHIKKEIEGGGIDTGKGNLQLMDVLDLTDTSDEAKVAAYEMFDMFFLDLDEDLQDADRINIMMSRKLQQYIIQGAAVKFNSPIQQVIMQTNNGVAFFDRQNVVLRPTKIMGRGQQMIAYTPGNLVYGTDLTRIGDPSSAHIDILPVQGDGNMFDFFMQVAIGTRIDLINSENFCVALDKTAGGTYNTFKDLTGDLKSLPTAPDAFDFANLTEEQKTALKAALGIA